MRIVATRCIAAFVLAIAVVAASLVGCGGPTNTRPPTSITFPGADRPVDLTVHVRADSTFEQVDELITRLTLRPGTAIDGSRINFEVRTVSVYLRSDSTPDERQRLRDMLLQSPIVTRVEP